MTEKENALNNKTTYSKNKIIMIDHLCAIVASMLFFFSSLTLKAQEYDALKRCETDSLNGIVVHKRADVPPQYPGGMQKLYEDIGTKIKIKSHSGEGCIKVILSFVIDVDGNVTNVCVTRNIENLKDVIEASGPWRPGKTGGVYVPVRMCLPVYIKLG